MLRSKRSLSLAVAQGPHSEEGDINELGNTTVVQSTRVAPSLGEIMRQPGGLERLDQTRLMRPPFDMEEILD